MQTDRYVFERQKSIQGQTDRRARKQINKQMLATNEYQLIKAAVRPEFKELTAPEELLMRQTTRFKKSSTILRMRSIHTKAI